MDLQSDDMQTTKRVHSVQTKQTTLQCDGRRTIKRISSVTTDHKRGVMPDYKTGPRGDDRQTTKRCGRVEDEGACVPAAGPIVPGPLAHLVYESMIIRQIAGTARVTNAAPPLPILAESTMDVLLTTCWKGAGGRLPWQLRHPGY